MNLRGLTGTATQRYIKLLTSIVVVSLIDTLFHHIHSIRIRGSWIVEKVYFIFSTRRATGNIITWIRCSNHSPSHLNQEFV
uniref:Uncharacterized protein n=1 Tax=Caenorhabditis japonica TaxID=281687 RepID=A0A8R1EB54_CAEJA